MRVNVVGTAMNYMPALFIALLVGCGAPPAPAELELEIADTCGSWPTPELEARIAELDADTTVTETTLSLYNVRHHLRITGVGSGASNFDRAYRIQLSNADGIVVDTLLTKMSFADSLDADFTARAGLYALNFDFVRSQSLYFNAFVGVDETDYIQPIGFFLTYTGERKGRMLYWLVPEDELGSE